MDLYLGQQEIHAKQILLPQLQNNWSSYTLQLNLEDKGYKKVEFFI
jgi:hypothetical protein